MFDDPRGTTIHFLRCHVDSIYIPDFGLSCLNPMRWNALIYSFGTFSYPVPQIALSAFALPHLQKQRLSPQLDGSMHIVAKVPSFMPGFSVSTASLCLVWA
jgi:hypothetical protein